jgi:hypothetical protein
MSGLLAALQSLPLSNLVSIFSVLGVISAAVVEINKQIRLLPPQDRNDWLHRALAAGLALENVASEQGLSGDNIPGIVGHVNSYLNLHGINMKVDSKQVKLLLAELKQDLEANTGPTAPVPVIPVVIVSTSSGPSGI